MAVTDLYNAAFMDHVSHPDYKYQLEDADCSHEGVNPSCGDELTFSVRFADDGTIEEAAFTGHGCAISQASADIMSDLMIDKTPRRHASSAPSSCAWFAARRPTTPRWRRSRTVCCCATSRTCPRA